MKMKIRYSTKERKYITPGTYQHVSAAAELEPTIIYRRPCGSGEASRRFYYTGIFPAPGDAQFAYDGMIHAPINRKENPHFRPKKLEWDDNVWRA